MKRVIVRLGNGLGNQLFTYAAAYTFAKKIMPNYILIMRVVFIKEITMSCTTFV